MILLLALPLALIPTTLNGWLLVRLVEGRTNVLMNAERWVTGGVLGLTLSMYAWFGLHVTTGVPLSLISMLGLQAALLVVLGGIWLMRKKSFTTANITLPASGTIPFPLTILLYALLAWTFLRVVVTGVTFLLLTPSYLQDTLNNWNLRGKMFFETNALTLVMPNEDPILSPRAISSYPPSVPLAKAWVSFVAGEWNDALINSIHGVWYLCAFALLYFTLRRTAGYWWALFGVYLIGSMPLYMMHGTNAYADAFVSIHVFMAVSLLFSALQADTPDARSSFLRLAALAAGVLAFTKNEGMLIYLPPLLLVTALGLLQLAWRGSMSVKQLFAAGSWYAGSLLLITLPWLLFKWWRGLTFGNGKPFTSLGFGWQEMVVQAVTVNTFGEGNWLLLFPLLFTLIVWRYRSAFTVLLPLTAFFLMVYVGQIVLYLFTGLSREALMQTGYARGLVQLMPVIILLTTLLIRSAQPVLEKAWSALARNNRLVRE